MNAEEQGRLWAARRALKRGKAVLEETLLKKREMRELESEFFFFSLVLVLLRCCAVVVTKPVFFSRGEVGRWKNVVFFY